MRLLRCHIDNFGKLTDYTVDFTENPQVFHEPNGWGKSTLAAFIKVMFYGFANEGKRGATLEKERVRYKPWQGGVYGGEIVFEAGGKTYLMNRTFGSKEAEDTFSLYDGVTNLHSEDYSANIGEELFQINQESFLRTVFLAQNACDTKTTDSINAKIGNLADNLDDINNYEKVQKVLKDILNSMSPTRKTGSLKQKKEEIVQRRDELRKAGVIESAVAELEEKVDLAIDKKEQMQSERRTTHAKWEILTRRKAVEAKKTHYESIVKQCLEKQNSADETLAAMGGQVPKQEELSEIFGQYRLWQEKESEAQANALNESEQQEFCQLRERFGEGIPDVEVLKSAREQLHHMETLRLEAAGRALDEGEALEKRRLEELFDIAGMQSGEAGPKKEDSYLAELEKQLEEGLQRVRLYIEQKNGLGAKRATLSSLKAMEQQQQMIYRQQEEQRRQQLLERQQTGKKMKTLGMAVLIVGLILAVAGGGLLALGNKTAGIVLLGVGAAVVLFCVILLVSKSNQEEVLPENTEGAMDSQKSATADGSIQELEQEIARDEMQMSGHRSYVNQILGQVTPMNEYDWEDPMRLRDKLYGFKDDVKTLQRLRAKDFDYKAGGYETAIQETKHCVAKVLEPYYGQVESERMSGLLTELCENREHFVRLDAREKRYGMAQEEAAQYRQQVADYLVKYHQPVTELYEGLQKLTAVLTDYENDCRELGRLNEEKAAFEAENDVAGFGQEWENIADSEEALKAHMEMLDEELTAIGEQIHAYQRQLEDKQAELEELSLQREELLQIEEEFEEQQTYYKRIGYVAEYLEKAKESLSARYIGPVLDSFKRNYELLSGESGEDFRMDANIQVTKRALGEQRQTEAFSAGNRDLINIVLRIALVDAMYQGEKPFLIIDDSFVNLDGRRLETAGKFMKQIARDYQVIYFTCHESRVLKD